jgi:hypothetical protein
LEPNDWISLRCPSVAPAGDPAAFMRAFACKSFAHCRRCTSNRPNVFRIGTPAVLVRAATMIERSNGCCIAAFQILFKNRDLLRPARIDVAMHHVGALLNL